MQKIRWGAGSLLVLSTLFLALMLYGGIRLRELDNTIKVRKEKISNAEVLLKSREEGLESEKRQYIALDEELKKQEGEFKKEKAKLNAINLYSVNSRSSAETLKCLSESVPAGLYLVSIRLEADRGILSGNSPTNELIARFMKNLNASGKFKNSQFLFTRRDQDSDLVYFEISVDQR